MLGRGTRSSVAVSIDASIVGRRLGVGLCLIWPIATYDFVGPSV